MNFHSLRTNKVRGLRLRTRKLPLETMRLDPSRNLFILQLAINLNKEYFSRPKDCWFKIFFGFMVKEILILTGFVLWVLVVRLPFMCLT